MVAPGGLGPVVPRAARAVAAAAADAAVQEVLTDPSSEALHAVSLASAAAAEATAMHFGSASRAPAGEPSTLPPGRPHQSIYDLAGRRAAPESEQIGSDLRTETQSRQSPRNTKVTRTLDNKIDLIRMYDSDVHSWPSPEEAFRKKTSRSVARRSCEPRKRAWLLKRMRNGEPIDDMRTRRSKFEEVDAALNTWFLGIETIGGAELPMTMSVLEKRAREIAAERGVKGSLGSPAFIQRWASRHHIKRLKLWGQAGSVAEAVR